MIPGAPEAFSRAVAELARLPGIGEKTAERLAFHLLSRPAAQSASLAAALSKLRERTRFCSVCHNLTEDELCAICADPARGEETVCVVEMPQDLQRLEAAVDYSGRYHVLGGCFAPLEGQFAEDLNLDSLARRARSGSVREIILALNPNTEGEATSELVARRLQGAGVSLTRLATGIPQGALIQWASRGSLQDAFSFRRPHEPWR